MMVVSINWGPFCGPPYHEGLFQGPLLLDPLLLEAPISAAVDTSNFVKRISGSYSGDMGS